MDHMTSHMEKYMLGCSGPSRKLSSVVSLTTRRSARCPPIHTSLTGVPTPCMVVPSHKIMQLVDLPPSTSKYSFPQHLWQIAHEILGLDTPRLSFEARPTQIFPDYGQDPILL